MHFHQIVIVSGPTGSGKSTLMKKIRENTLPEISKQLGLDNPSKWVFVMDEFKALELPESHLDSLIIHYDFLRPILREQLQNYEEDECLSVLPNSDKITFVTLWAKPEILIERLKLRKKRFFFENSDLQGFIYFSKSKNKSQIMRNLFLKYLSRKPKKLHEMYNSTSIYEAYEKWFNFCSSFDGSVNWIVDNSKDNILNIQLIPQSKWRNKIDSKTY